MTTNLRALTPDDAPALDFLMAEAFSGGTRPAPAEPDIASPTLGVFDGARLVAAATVHNLHVTWGAADAPIGGVAGVACTADQRGRGHTARLLAEALRLMRDRGQYLSGLYPFAFAFYRRHGWEWVGEKRQYTVPTAQIKSSPEGRHVRAYDGPEALDAVRPVYDAFARRYPGMTTRRGPVPNFWDKALGHKDNRTTYVQVYQNPENGEAEGYLTFRYPDGGDTGQIGDFFSLTPAAYKGLLSVLHYYGAQVPKVEFTAPADDPLPFHVMHWDLETRVRPLFMGRVVDVGAALSALRPDEAVTDRVVLQVQDEQCEWNVGTFAVSAEAGRVTVQPTTDAAGVALDIQALTQAYWGQPGLDRLRAAGRLSVTDEAQYALLCCLLLPRVCYLQDFF